MEIVGRNFKDFGRSASADVAFGPDLDKASTQIKGSS